MGTEFIDSKEGQEFIASGHSRETSPEILKAIAFFARNIDEAEAVWNGDFGTVCSMTNIWENVTSNGVHDSKDFCWGVEGSEWWINENKAA